MGELEPGDLNPKDPSVVICPDAVLNEHAEQVLAAASGSRNYKYARFIAAAALGSIPWIGGVLAAAIALQAEGQQEKLNDLQKIWLSEHQNKLHQLGSTINSVAGRLEDFGDEVQERIESKEYLSLIRKGFKAWDQADTEEKREYIRKLLSNAGGTKLCSDDVNRDLTFRGSTIRTWREACREGFDCSTTQVDSASC